MENKQLLNKNFVLVILGQLISIFANSVLRFALPLYILDQTGSTVICFNKVDNQNTKIKSTK